MNIIDLSLAVVYTLIFPGFLFAIVACCSRRLISDRSDQRISPPWYNLCRRR
jgi:hypothetical protein